MTAASAPGKIILYGEHAVVYGRPAIAAPLMNVRATSTVVESTEPGVHLHAPDLRRHYRLQDARRNDPFAKAVVLALKAVAPDREPDIEITVKSDIPIASGLGSGAAMAAAVIRAVYNHLTKNGPASDELVSSLTFEVERILHGTPSGIDNSVVSTERPIYFVRDQPVNRIEILEVANPIRILVADSGIASRTKDVVGDVRRRWKENTIEFERLFDACGQVSRRAREAIEHGDTTRLGRLMRDNQAYLRQITVSSPELEVLIKTAEEEGSLGAKLSGAGRGGNMIALVDEGNIERVRKALIAAGAVRVIVSEVG